MRSSIPVRQPSSSLLPALLLLAVASVACTGTTTTHTEPLTPNEQKSLYGLLSTGGFHPLYIHDDPAAPGCATYARTTEEKFCVGSATLDRSRSGPGLVGMWATKETCSAVGYPLDWDTRCTELSDPKACRCAGDLAKADAMGGRPLPVGPTSWYQKGCTLGDAESCALLAPPVSAATKAGDSATMTLASTAPASSSSPTSHASTASRAHAAAPGARHTPRPSRR